MPGSLDVRLSASVEPKLSTTLHTSLVLITVFKRDSTFAKVAFDTFPYRRNECEQFISCISSRLRVEVKGRKSAGII